MSPCGAGRLYVTVSIEISLLRSRAFDYLAEAVRIGQNVNSHDPVACHTESQHRHRFSIGKPRYNPWCSIHEHRVSFLRYLGESERLFRNLSSAANAL